MIATTAGDVTRFEPLGDRGFRAEVAAFVNAVRSGGASPIPASDGIAALRTALAAEESMRTGLPSRLRRTRHDAARTASVCSGAPTCRMPWPTRGRHRRRHGRSLSVSTPNPPELAARFAGRFDAPIVQSADELVASAGLEAVVVCSATAAHRQLTELAAGAGLHVLSEKPIATTLADGQAMVDACAGAGVQLHVAFSTRFYPMVQQVRAAIRDGVLGEIVGLVGGNRGRPPLPPDYPSWITDPAEAGGGALIDHSVHVTDVMRHVSGLEVADVGAEVDSMFWGAGVDDMAILSLRFAGGAIGSGRSELVGARRTTRGTTTSSCGCSGRRAHSPSEIPPRASTSSVRLGRSGSGARAIRR